MLLSETWLKPTTPNRLIVIPGFRLARADRPDGRGYGGVAALVKEGVTAAPLKVGTSRINGSKLEVIWMMVKLDRGRQLVIGSLYRPPRHTVDALRADFEDLETQVQYITIYHPNTGIVMCGDLNCDMLKKLTDLGRSRLEEFISMYSLHQIVTEPTFSSGSLHDVCLLKGCDNILSCCTYDCHFSPHKFNHFHIAVHRNRTKATHVMSRCIKRLNVRAFHDDLPATDWSLVFKSSGVSKKWEVFLSLFLPILDHHAPLKKITIRNPTAPPATDATKNLMVQRRIALRDVGRDSSEYRDLNRAVRSAIRKDTRNDIQNRIDEQGPATVW